MRMLIVFCLIGIFLVSVCCANAKAPEASIKWAERWLAKAEFDRQSGQPYPAQWSLREAEQGFSSILTKYGADDGRAWAGLARSQAGLGKYDKSINSYKKALSLLPGHQNLQKELDVVLKQQAIAKAVSSQLPEGEEVLQAVPYPVPGEEGLWAVLTGKVVWDEELHPFWPNITDSRLTVFRGNPESLKELWNARILWHLGSEEINEVYLYIHDVTGDGIPEMVLPEIIFGGSWIPSHIDIFTWKSGRAVKLFGAIADESIIIKDLDNNGTYEVITDHAIGVSLAHYEQPRWQYTYAYKNGAYQLAEKDFPEVYRGLDKEIKARLKEYPDDYELLFYLGRLYEIQRKPKAALKAYYKAEANIPASQQYFSQQNEIRTNIDRLKK